MRGGIARTLRRRRPSWPSKNVVMPLAGIEPSMSGRGDCWDNAPCEGWFGKLKSEWVYPHDVYATRKEAEMKIVEYIEMFYNGERLHQALV
jgi:transposase InsO family protein